jgi:hypothetical protein
MDAVENIYSSIISLLEGKIYFFLKNNNTTRNAAGQQNEKAEAPSDITSLISGALAERAKQGFYCTSSFAYIISHLSISLLKNIFSRVILSSSSPANLLFSTIIMLLIKRLDWPYKYLCI